VDADEDRTGTTRHTSRGVVRVIGVGNDYRGDDAVGLVVARALRARRVAGMGVLEQSGEATALLEAWRGAECAVLVDALAAGGTPGAIRRLDARTRPLPADLFAYSSHGFGVAQAIGLGRLLGRLPPRLIVFGVEGARFTAGSPLSPDVDRAVPRVVDLILREQAG
jgi:hydrogenase maturation protease